MVADVVDEDVHASEMCDDLVAHALHVVPVADVSLEGRCFASVRADAISCRLGTGGRAPVVNGDGCAFHGERLRDCSAEAGSRAGHERDPALESPAHRAPFVAGGQTRRRSRQRRAKTASPPI